LRDEIARSSWKSLRADATAALSVSLLALPQAMAYALVAGLPVSAGLLSAFIGAMVAASAGSSRHLVIGPTNAIAVLLQAASADILDNHYHDLDPVRRAEVAQGIVLQMGLLIGLLQLLAGYLQMGKLVHFVSRSVIVGYVLGAACTIVLGQLFVLTGTARPEGMGSFVEQAYYLLGQLHSAHHLSCLLGALALLLAVGLSRLRLPGPPMIWMLLIMSVGVSYLPAAAGRVALVGDYGDLTHVLSGFVLPSMSLHLLSELLPDAFAIALLSVLESSSAAKAVSARSGQSFDMNQEIVGLGLCNFVSACVGAMPASGSNARSFLNFSCGAQTRFSSVFAGLAVGLIWALLGHAVAQIPLVALSAILLVTVPRMIDRRQLRLCLWATGSDAAVLLVTFLSALLLSLDVAFYTGVILSLTLYLRDVAMPHFVEHPLPMLSRYFKRDEFASRSGVKVIEIAGELFFGSSELLEAGLRDVMHSRSTNVLVLRLRKLYRIDATTCLTIERVHESLKSRGKRLILCDVSVPVMGVLKDTGVADLFEENEIFFDESAHPAQSLEAALQAVCTPA
jgi:SulP family sulfate permease